MKMIAYAVDEAERPIFERYYRDYGIELTMTSERPKPENAHLTQGADCINVLSETVITPELWDIYHKNGVHLGVTRCVGMEHMNADYAKTLGIGVRNVRARILMAHPGNAFTLYSKENLGTIVRITLYLEEE